MNRVEIAERFGHMFRISREITGTSQDYMAKALGVSRRTVQNWENGMSCPSQMVALEWFEVLGLQPLPFYLRLLYPETFTGLQSDLDEKRIEEGLIRIIKDMPLESKRKLLYLICGDHGSSVNGMIELINAHLQSPLRDRINVAQSVLTNYEIAAETGLIRRPAQVQPNTEMLREFIQKGREAVVQGKENYSTL